MKRTTLTTTIFLATAILMCSGFSPADAVAGRPDHVKGRDGGSHWGRHHDNGRDHGRGHDRDRGHYRRDVDGDSDSDSGRRFARYGSGHAYRHADYRGYRSGYHKARVYDHRKPFYKWRGQSAHVHPSYRHRPSHHGHHRWAPVPRHRYYRGVHVTRHYGHRYPGYAYFYTDDDAFAWIAFTAITLKVLDNINEDAQRKHEAAQVQAASARVGETILWNEGNASGSVTTTRDGASTSGRYCREFHHKIKIADRVEEAYGTACRQPDGSWEIVSPQS